MERIISKINDIMMSDTVKLFGDLFIFAARFVLPVLALIIIVRCVRSLLLERQDTETWASLSLPNGARIPVNHWENLIGRGKACDIMLEYPTLSRLHGALIRDAKGNWKVYDLNSKGGIRVNGAEVNGHSAVKAGDVMEMGGVELVLIPASDQDVEEENEFRRRPGRIIRPAPTLLLVTLFALILMISHCFSADLGQIVQICLGFGGLIALMWLVFWFYLACDRTGFEIESMAFLLCSIGMSVADSSVPNAMYKQLAFMTAGICLFLGLCWFLRDLNVAKKLRWPIAAAGFGLLCVNLLMADSLFGAKNWLNLGGFTFQPSEFVKISFILAGAATMDRLFAKRNILLFIAFAGACVGALALMSDLGTALVFFTAYLVIAFLRSGSFSTVVMSIAGGGFAGLIVITAKPYIISRFATWGKAWLDANGGGYQQTRAMAASASGGLFGVGPGKGWLVDVVAADTDLVFGVLCEELGLIIALLAVIVLVLYAIFTVRSSYTARSSFYVIASCAAVAIFLCQAALNVLGSMDILPFTGVTLPFISRGGSSLIACWGMLAFLKAADTRQNASLAIKLRRRGEGAL